MVRYQKKKRAWIISLKNVFDHHISVKKRLRLKRIAWSVPLNSKYLHGYLTLETKIAYHTHKYLFHGSIYISTLSHSLCNDNNSRFHVIPECCYRGSSSWQRLGFPLKERGKGRPPKWSTDSYSERSAWTGSSRAARRAGRTPESRPTHAANSSASNT